MTSSQRSKQGGSPDPSVPWVAWLGQSGGRQFNSGFAVKTASYGGIRYYRRTLLPMEQVVRKGHSRRWVNIPTIRVSSGAGISQFSSFGECVPAQPLIEIWQPAALRRAAKRWLSRIGGNPQS